MWEFISSYGIVLLFVAGAIVLWRRFGRYALAFALTWLLNTSLKYLINRPRPFETGAEVSAQLLVHTPSFPSGHTAAAFAAAVFVFLHNRKWGAVLLVLSGLIGISRVMVGVHFASDVVAGAIVGIVVSYALHVLYERRDYGRGRRQTSVADEPQKPA